MKTAGLSLSIKNILTVLPSVFSNVANAFTGMAIAFDSGGAKISKLRRVMMAAKTGFSGFLEVLKANKITVFIIAIVALVSAISKLTNAARESKEALHEQYISDADKAAEQLSDTKETNSQLSEIIEKYKAIAASNQTEFEKRFQLRSLQEELNKLLGAEASAVDIVNGKLSTQLSTLKGINLEQSKRLYSEAISSAKSYSLSSETDTYHNAPGVPVLGDIFPFLKDANDWLSEDRDYTFKVDDKDVEMISDIQESLEKIGVNLRNFTEGKVRTGEPYVRIELDTDMSMAEVKETLNAGMAQLQSDGLGDTTTAKELSRIYTQMFGKDSNFEKSVSYYKDALDIAIALSEDVQNAESKSIRSYEDYLKLRDEVVNSVKANNPELQDALDNDWLSYTDIYNAIDKRLQGFDNLKKYYVGNDIVTTIQDIETTFSKRAFDNSGKAAYAEAKEWFDNLSPDDKTLIYQIGLDTTTAHWELEDWKKMLIEAKNDTVEIMPSFGEAIKNIFLTKDSESGDTFSARVKTYREDINSLSEALAKFKNGEMDEDTFHGLVEKFPQLAGQASDLDAAIISLMDDMDSDIASDFEAQFGELETQEDIDALKEYERQVLSTRGTTEKFESSIENVVSAFQTVKGVIDEYNENGYLTLSNLQSILALDDRYINTLTNEQGALDLSAESYKRLVQAELTELKAQALQDSINAVNKIESKAQALVYLEGAQASAAQSSLDLADAQWQEALATAAVKDLEQGTGDLYQRTVIAARQAYETKAALIDSYAKTALTVGELTVTTDDYTEALNNEKDALESSKKALEDQKGALEDTKQGYEDALDSVKDLVGWVQNYIKQVKNDEIDALEKKKDTIDGLIDKQKELLDAEKEEYEWNKTITEKQNTVAKDALAVSIASLDDSSAGRKSQKEANDKLSESRADMLDTLYDHEIEQRKKALDDLKEEQDEYYDSLISEIQDYLGDEVRLYKDACEMIDNDSGDLYAKLLWYCQNYTTTSEAEFNHMWNSAQSAMQQYNTANLGTFELLNNLQGRIYEVDAAIDTIAQGISSYENAIEGVQSKLDNLSASAQKSISDIQAATKAEEEWRKSTSPKWYAIYRGLKFESSASVSDTAYREIKAKIKNAFGKSYDDFQLNHYADGTNFASGGVSLVGERGAELRVLNRGDGILKNQIVRGLTALGTNPAQFLAEAGRKMLATVFGSRMKSDFGAIAGAGSISPSISIVIQGDATQSTVNALNAQAQKIMNDTLRLVQADTLKRTHSNRVR